MRFISGIANIFLLIIFWLGKHDMTSAIYEIPAIIAVMIAWVTIIKAKSRMINDAYNKRLCAKFLVSSTPPSF